VKRRWPVAAASVAVVATGMSLVGVVGGGGRASANPTGASPQVFVGGPGSSNNGPYDQFNLSSLQAGGAAPVASGTLGSGVASVAINPTASKVVYGLLPPTATIRAFLPLIAVEDVASRTTSRTNTANNPIGIAADPTDSSRAYVLESTYNQSSGVYSNSIDTVGISTSPPIDSQLTSGIGGVTIPAAIAISPDGSTLFVSGTAGRLGGITALSVTNPTQSSTYNFDHVGSIVDIAVAPSGDMLYAISAGTPTSSPNGWVLALPLPLKAGEVPSWSPQPLSFVPTSITVSPEGQTLYVTGSQGVQSFSPSTGVPGTLRQLPSAGGAATQALSPDGSTLVVAGTDSATGDTIVYTLAAPSLVLGNATHLGTGFGTLTGPEKLAITPDQAPVASFSAIPGASGTPTSFDAGGSSVAYGSVNNFTWDFGDGHGTATATSQASHVYATPGNYKVTLTETDSAGTSIPPAVFLTGFSVNGPGQTPFRRADNSARTSRVVSVAAPGSTTTTTAVPAPGTPTLTLNPALGPPGTLVTVTGSGFPANTPITISWSVSTGSVVITSDAGGNLPPTILPILVPDVLGPRFAVSATSPQAQAPFLVVPGTAEPGGEDGSYLFRTEGP